MHCLVDIKELLIQHNFKNIVSGGWFLICQGDRWTMANDVVYLNNNPITKKEILQYIKRGPKAAPLKPLKMITPKGYDHDSDCIEVDDE